MSILTRSKPYNELVSMRREMDRLFKDFLTNPLMVIDVRNQPKIDLLQADDEIIIKASLPDLDPDDLDIQISGDTLILHGESNEEEEIKEAKYFLRERRYQYFSRSLILPVSVISEKVQAEMKNGILTLILPKAEEVKPKVINVKAK